MCVIIVREPGVTIPFTKIKSACTVNPDGWGIAVADRGKLELQWACTKEDNDPDAVFKALEDAKQLPVLLHLRYVTAGARSLANCHPFKVLTRDKHGVDVVFAHNGTLYVYKESKSDYSDSYFFVEKFVRPLLERTIAFTGPEKLLHDDFIDELLSDKAGASSVFTLFDGDGTALLINSKQGIEHEGWWSSNSYSFQENHRSSKSTTTSYYGTSYLDHYKGHGYTAWDGETYEAAAYGAATPSTSTAVVPFETKSNPKKIHKEMITADEIEFQNTSSDELDQRQALYEQTTSIKEIFKSMNTPRMNPNLVKALTEMKRDTFVELCGITDLGEVTRFDPDDISEMVSLHPEAATLLLQDLLYELYVRNTRDAKIAAAKARTEVVIANTNSRSVQ